MGVDLSNAFRHFLIVNQLELDRSDFIGWMTPGGNCGFCYLNNEINYFVKEDK